MTTDDRPTLTRATLRRWLPLLPRRVPDPVSAYLVPGRLPARSRAVAMLRITWANRCHVEGDRILGDEPMVKTDVIAAGRPWREVTA